MTKLNYLNVGCGNKFHIDWVNIDMFSNNPHVISHNLLTGFPFEDDKFDVLYHSQVLEHFPKDKGVNFIKDCNRILKPGGTIRVVVPDLENIINEYQKYLNENLNHLNKLSEANYDWVMLEIYDQAVRNYFGGGMAEYLRQPELVNEKFIIDRIGFVGRFLRDEYFKNKDASIVKTGRKKDESLFQKISRNLKSDSIRRRLLNKLLTEKEKQYLNVGEFRLGGEVHFWMYDRFSLKRLLELSGFEHVELKSPLTSNIPNWSEYELDVKNGFIYDPTSLFVEAKKIKK